MMRITGPLPYPLKYHSNCIFRFTIPAVFGIGEIDK
jgi:hypothetical protein